ncbi:hypothetical protein EDD16DRAFT_1521245 [Pisolithus croceorrhizus]|nr:hypothetical protein EDD16DRAFT_1521245 [Pisolithus croceorrhizus]KAI6134228.1 hypothetical protein EV401DRAFT_1882775 [Pisolithus croceorrhizus]KAI6143548.1 hypothetical protein EDD17DRAFT_1515521 [Pisolithus thermaeus]
MYSQPKDSYGYPTNTDAGQPMDDAGEELVKGPDGNFDIVELEVLAWRRREWTQVGKKEKSTIMCEICKEFVKMEKHCNLRLVEWQEKEEEALNNCLLSIQVLYVVWELYHNQIQLKHAHMKIEGGTQVTKQINLYQQVLSAFIQEDLTDEQQQAAQDIVEKWNETEGPTPEVQPHMDFNNDIGGSHMFDGIHTISASWREYLGNAYKNPNIAAGEEGYLTVHYHEPQTHAHFNSDAVAQLLERMPDTEEEATNDMKIPEISSRGKSNTDDEEQHEAMSTEEGRAGNKALPVVKCPSTSRQSTIQLKGSWVTAELQDTSGYTDDDKFDSMPFADVHTTQSGLSSQHDQGRKLKSAMKRHFGHEQNDMEAQPKLKTSSNVQKSMIKPTKRHEAANDHSSPPGPSTKAVPNKVQPWKSLQAHQAPVLADANAPSPPPKKMQKNKPSKSEDTSKKRHGNV